MVFLVTQLVLQQGLYCQTMWPPSPMMLCALGHLLDIIRTNMHSPNLCPSDHADSDAAGAMTTALATLHSITWDAVRLATTSDETMSKLLSLIEDG